MEHLQAKSSQVRLDWRQNSPSNTQPEVIHQYWSIDRSSNAPSASNGFLASRESRQQSVKPIQASFFKYRRISHHKGSQLLSVNSQQSTVNSDMKLMTDD